MIGGMFSVGNGGLPMKGYIPAWAMDIGMGDTQ